MFIPMPPGSSAFCLSLFLLLLPPMLTLSNHNFADKRVGVAAAVPNESPALSSET